MFDINIERKHLPAVAIVCMLLLTHMVALNVVNTYPDEYQAFGEDVDDPTNPLIFVVAIVVFTAGVLMVFKYGKGNYLKYAILAVVGLSLFYVLYPVLFEIGYPIIEALKFDIALILSLALAISLTYLLYKKPEWYVVNGIGVVMGAGIAAIFGISLGILPVFILLIILATYDFISVYKTKHMLSLASGVMKQKLPIMLAVPQKMDYSFSEGTEKIAEEVEEKKESKEGKKQKEKQQEGKKGESKAGKRERDAMFIGLGDFIIPGILPVSASIHLESVAVAGFSAPHLVALGSIMGALVGMIALTRFVLKGKPHAGLPLLNSGAIIGYMLAYLLVYQNLTFGIVLPW